VVGSFLIVGACYYLRVRPTKSDSDKVLIFSGNRASRGAKNYYTLADGEKMKPHFVVLTALLWATTSGADTLRCGGKIVQTGMTMAEVKKYCGNPSSTSIEEQDVRAGPRVVGKTQVHTWRYNRSSGQRTAVLEFDLQKLMSITYESK